MSMVIANNMQAVNTKRQFAASARGMSGSMEKLSSGYKINTGKDDPAGLVISEQLRSQLNGLKRAQQNTEEAINVMGIAEGALNEMNNILKKMKALAIHSANTGVTSPDQIAADQAEMDSAIQTLDRIASTTKFSDQNLLNGQKDITYEQTTATQGTQQNSLINARETAVNQIFKRDGSSIAMSFTGTTNANALTGTGDTDFSQQAMKAYMEIDTARGATMSQLDAQGKFTQEQSFTLTGSRGSRSFKFKQGTSVTELVKQVHASAGSTGVDAALVFNSAQRIDKLTDGNGEFAAQVENKFKMDGLVNEKGESLYLTVNYDEANKDKVNLDAFKSGLDFEIEMNDDLDVYGMPTYKVSLGGKTLMETWDGKAESFNSNMTDIIANNSEAGDEFAHLKYMNFSMDTDIDPRESFKGDDLFQWDATTAATDRTITLTGIDDPATVELEVNFDGLDPTLFVGGAATFSATTSAQNPNMLTLSLTVDGVTHTLDVALSDIARGSAGSTTTLGAEDVAGANNTIGVANSLFHGIVITNNNAVTWDDDTFVHAAADVTDDVPATATGVEFDPAGPAKPKTTTTLRATGLDNVPEKPTAVTKPTEPRQQVEKPIDPESINPGLIRPAQPTDGNGGATRPNSITTVANFVTATGMLAADGSDISLTVGGRAGTTEERQKALQALKDALGDDDIEFTFEVNGDGSSIANTTWKVSAVVGTGADAKTFTLTDNWNGIAPLTYDNADDDTALGKALQGVEFTAPTAVDKGVTLQGAVTGGLQGTTTVAGPFSAADGQITIDWGNMSEAQQTALFGALTADEKADFLNGNFAVKVTTTTGTTAVDLTGATISLSLEFASGTSEALGTFTYANSDTDVNVTGNLTGAYSTLGFTVSGVAGSAAVVGDNSNAAFTPTPDTSMAGNQTSAWTGGNPPAANTSTSNDADAFNGVTANIRGQATWDENKTKYDAAMEQWRKDDAQYTKDLAAYTKAVADYPAAMRAYEADQARLVEAMKTYNAQMKDYRVYEEQLAKYEAGSNVVKNGKPAGTDLIPDPASVTGGVAIGKEAASVAREKGTVAVFNNEIAKDGSGKVERGVQGVSFSDDAAASIHYGKNTDGQGRIYVKFLDDNTFELYKDSSLSEQSKVASGINGQEIKEANNSGLRA